MIMTLEGDYISTDRWMLNTTKLESNETKTFIPSGTDYILLRNASYEDGNKQIKNVYGAFMVNQVYTLSCGDDSSAIVISCPGFRYKESQYYIQNELDIGNLSYMDGGTNTTAITPPRLGDPVVNYVHFPKYMYQTLHTHPSHRIGLILKGNGKIELNDKKFHDIVEGEAFFMRRNELHNFITEDEDVILFVFAPDSGDGPTDEINPLKVRTYIGQQRK